MTAQTLSYTVVDAFTSRPFKGNPASVIILSEGVTLPDDTLQGIAMEFNLSETAFITPSQGPDDHESDTRTFGLRWFTPEHEVALCGHATLASAKVLFSTPLLVPSNVSLLRFNTISGVLTAAKITSPDGSEPKIELDFPSGELHSSGFKGSLDLDKVHSIIQRAFGVDHDNLIKFLGAGEGVSFDKYLVIEIDGEKVQLEGARVDCSLL